MLVVDRGHRRTTRLDPTLEQAQLGGKISAERRVIIEMIAPEIGEAAGAHVHAVETALIESMRGGFDGEMRPTFARELIERAVQGNRVGGGERAVDLVLRR